MDPTTTVVSEEIVKGVVAQIKHQFSYLSQYLDNIENLSSKLKILEDRREDVQDKVNAAINNSQIIKDGVTNWLANVEVIKTEAVGILKDKDKVGNGCWKGWCLSLKSRHSLSRKAAKEAPKLDVLLVEGDQFRTVAKPQLPLGVVHVPAHSSEIQQANQAVEIQGDEKSENSASYNATQHVLEGIASSSAGTSGGLESRLSILRDVMEAVKDGQIRIVRICGMGGVGKTTIAKEVEKMARDQFLFHEIAMVEVNQEPDLKRVQLHIAERLGLELKEDDVKARAARLLDRLNREGQNKGQTDQRPNDGGENKGILVILDNVWRREDLEEIGIPLGDEQKCKILLTSRQVDVCKNIAPEKEFNIGVLSDPEDMILFRQSLGNSPCYDQIAKEIVKACAGLPIAIKTIARAVANQSENAWTVAVKELQKPNALEGEYPAVSNCLNVSFGFLKNVEIKKFFRLCCLFPKGSDVPIEDLARYGMALRLFKDNDKLYEARKKAHRNVEILLHSNLLLGSDQKECVKMHDIVWDFAVSTSSNGLFMVNYGDGLKEWPRRYSYEDFTSISLLCSEMKVVPEGLACRNLELLQLTGKGYDTKLKFPEKFYEGMGRLNVLAFRSMNIPLTPKSLKFLTNLRTLSLHQCSLGNVVSMIGDLEKLEVLSFAYSNIMELPTVIGNLKELRLLDLTRCEQLHIIAPGVLSSLISLEELYMRGTPLTQKDRVQATLTEIASLSKLVVIDIEIPLEVLPMDSLFEKLEKFKISINKYDRSKAEYLFPNSLDLICDSSVLLQDGIKFLVQETERMYLKVGGLKTLLDSSETWDFSNLKSLLLVSCNELVYLINSGREIEFRSLKYLSLQGLPKLVGFCKAWDAVEFPQLEELELHNLPLLTSFHLETETSALGHNRASSSNPPFNRKGLHPICRFPKLRSLKVSSCSRLRHLSTLSTFGELQHLEVQSCKSLQAIVAVEERKEADGAIGGILLPKLNHLHLSDLPYLSTIVPKGYTLRWSSLKKLEVINCGGESDLFANTNNTQKGTTEPEIALTSLEELTTEKTNSTEFWRNHFPCGFSYKLRAMYKYSCDTPLVLFSPHLIRGFHHLEKLSVLNCESLEVVFDLEELIVGGRDHKVAMLSKLDYVRLWGLRSMTHVWKKVPKNLEGGFHNLTRLEVSRCDSLRYLFSLSIAKSLVKLQEIDISDCEVMEEVVSKRDEEEEQGQQNAVDIVFFPQLQELGLSKLRSLKCFGPTFGSTDKVATTSLEDLEIRGANSSMELCRDHFASGYSYGLRKMWVRDCDKLPVLFPSHLVQGFPHLIDLKIYDCYSLEVVFDLEELTVGGRHKIVMLNRLAEMTLHQLPRMAHVWKNVPKDFNGFHNLTSLIVKDCNSLRYLFSHLIAKCLVRLRKLSIDHCEKMEEVISSEIRDEEGEVQENSVDMINLFPELHELMLEQLPSLLIFLGPVPARAPTPGGANYDFDKQLSFGAPPNNVGTDDQGNASSSTSTRILNQNIAMTSLEDMEIRGANSLFGTSGFSYRLRKMVVLECDKLPAVLFPPHLVQGFPHLEELRIYRRDSLEVVFDLQELTVGGRHKIVMLNRLAEMTLEYLPRMVHVWKKVPKDFDGFHNLTSLNVRGCDSLRYLFSPLIAKCLVRLRKLSIDQCKKMEEVVSSSSEIRDEEGEVQENSVDMINLFPELHELELKYLPSLLICLGPAPGGANYDFDKQLSFGAPPNNFGTDDQGNASSSTSTHILNEKSSNPGPSSALVGIGRCQLPAWSLHNLTRLKVHDCNKLLYLFPPHMVVRLPVLQNLSIVYCNSLRYLFCSSTATSLVQLRDLNIYGCEMMEVIVKDEDEVEVDRMGKLIVFSSLISVRLRMLSNLKGFCLEELCFEWPLLTSVEIQSCWKMGIFISGYSNTPILDGVFINSHKYNLEEDLNTTLMSLQQKVNLALKEEGILTINGFVIAGDHLVAQCPSWSWHSAERWEFGLDLPDDRKFLITRNVPCLRRASSKVVVEDKNEGDDCGGDDKNIPRPRSYDVSITYNKRNKSPRLWLRGYNDDESKMILPLELVLQDIAEHHPRELVTIERHPHLHENRVSLYPHLQLNFIKDFYDHRALQGIQPNVENYLHILLEAYASVVPTIKYRYC